MELLYPEKFCLYINYLTIDLLYEIMYLYKYCHQATAYLLF